MHRFNPIITIQSPSLLDCLSELRDDLTRVLGTKDGAAGNNDVGTGVSSSVNSALGETTVDLDVQLGVALAQSLDLGHHVGHELLAAEAGLDGHNEGHLDNEGQLRHSA